MMSGSGGWTEPTRSLTLRFGAYRSRYVVAVVLLFGGGLLVQLGSVYTTGALVLGSVASIVGWVVIPSVGWRRLLAIVPAFLGVVSLLNGAASGALLLLTLAGWLLVRMRPLRSYSSVAIPLATALVLAAYFPQYDSRISVVVGMAVALIAAAWVARSLAAWRRRPSRAAFQPSHSDRTLK